MNKFEQMSMMVQSNNGYLFTSEVEKAGISRTYMLRYVKENGMEQASHGVYVTEDTWPDQLFIIQKSNPKVIFSGETAAYLNGLMEREYSEICVCVPSGHNGARLREKGIVVRQENAAIYGMGVSEITTNYGNVVRAYNKERCFCDFVKNRSKYEVQTYQTAVKSYMRRNDKDLSLLIGYADALKIRDEVMKYVEVLV